MAVIINNFTRIYMKTKWMLLLCSAFLIGIVFLTGCTKINNTSNDPVPVHDTFTIASKIVNENRVINVWIPEAYAKEGKPLPVMYMADGGVKEDFPHIANTFAKLIKAKKIPAFILVGIENTQRRRDLTGPTEVAEDKEIAPVVGGSEKFRAFLKEELFPEISSRYKTTSDRGILGESLAGLFVMETFLLQPDMFTYYIAFDPSLWWNDNALVKAAKNTLGHLPADKKTVWFAGSSDIATYTDELATVLKEENVSGLRWVYSHEPKEQHSTILRATKEKALIWALN